MTDPDPQPSPARPRGAAPPTPTSRRGGAARRPPMMLGEIEKRIVGQREVVDALLVALFARGHCLFVGVPGLAKTLLISTLADVLDLSFNRIQFTPDLMPSDITGTDMLEEDQATGRRAFRFVHGPLFANMSWPTKSTARRRRPRPRCCKRCRSTASPPAARPTRSTLPFLVFATQNPIEQEGTYPLPEAQLDRFMFHVDVGYPSAAEEMPSSAHHAAVRRRSTQVLSPDKIRDSRTWSGGCPSADHVVQVRGRAGPRAPAPKEPGAPDFIAARTSPGAPARAPPYLVIGAKARAILDGRLSPRSRTSARSPGRCCATACCPTSTPRPRASPACRSGRPAART